MSAGVMNTKPQNVWLLVNRVRRRLRGGPLEVAGKEETGEDINEGAERGDRC